MRRFNLLAPLPVHREGLDVARVVHDAHLERARAVRIAVASRYPVAPVSIDLPEGNAPLRARLSQLGFTSAFETARMYRGPAPNTSASLQAIATMELG